MKVRDKRYKKTDFKGHEINCPYPGGCPSQKPRPKHLFKNTKKFQNRKSGDIFKCVRCGQLCEFGACKFDFETIN